VKTIGICDFSHALRVNYHVRPGDGSPTHAGEQTLAQLSDWRRGLDHFIVALDSPPYDRLKAYPEYKAGRPRDDGYIQVCRWTRERLVADGYSIAAHPGAEADDVIATLAHLLTGASLAEDVRIFGADKDCLQCVTEWKSGITVRQFVPGAGGFEVRDVEWVKTRYGVTPEQIPLLLAIMGDKGDNIPGIAGIGEKGAAKLITTYGDIIKMRMAALDAFTASKQDGAKPLSSFWQKFLDGSPRLPEWLALTSLRSDLPLDVDALLVKQPIKPLVVSAEDIEHGDAWEPSEEELAAERAMLDPEAIISGPPKENADQMRARMYAEDPDFKAHAEQREAKTEPKKASTTGRTSGDTSTESTAPRAASAHRSAHSDPVTPATTESVSVVVDRPAPPSWALALQPASAKEALQMATVLFNSRHYSKYGSEKGTFSAIMLGRELGLGAVASLMGLHIISDKPFLSANLMRALAEAHQDCEWIMIVQADDEKATAKTRHRKAGDLEYVYTRERAEQAGYFTGGNKANWIQKTQEMLEARCISKAVRRWYPSSVMGMHSEDEGRDD
jgi:5'-3' exonuclease